MPLPEVAAETYVDAMREALALAEMSAAPDGRQVDVPVGALVIGPRGDRIATGTNVRELDHDPTGHAEMVAIRSAASALGSWRLEGCTLVVTLEPCTMCAGAIVLARLETLVFGAYDDKAGAVGSLWDVVRDRRLNHRPRVVGGVLAAENGALLRRFFAGRR
jgi:tRNA(adenine34) deaminase